MHSAVFLYLSESILPLCHFRGSWSNRSSAVRFHDAWIRELTDLLTTIPVFAHCVLDPVCLWQLSFYLLMLQPVSGEVTLTGKQLPDFVSLGWCLHATKVHFQPSYHPITKHLWMSRSEMNHLWHDSRHTLVFTEGMNAVYEGRSHFSYAPDFRAAGVILFSLLYGFTLLGQ